MEAPNVVTEMKNLALNFTFCVRAYRKVTQAEMRFAYAMWKGQKKSNKPKRNQHIEVISVIGHDE